MEQVSQKLFKGALWLSFAGLLVNCLGLLSTFVLARLLSPSDFGIVAIATSILAIALSVTDLSLASALVQRTDLTEEHFHSVWTIGLLRSLATFVAIALAAYPLARFYGDPRLTAVLLAAGFTAALPGLNSPRIITRTRNLVFWQDFVVQTVQRLLVFVGAVAYAIIYQNYWALIVGNLIGALTSVALSYLISPYIPRLSLSKFKELFAYSSWLSMGDTVNTFNWRFDQLVLGYLVGKAPLGIYTVADNIAALPVREATMPLAKTLFPAFSRIAHDPERLRLAYLRSQSLICAVAMPVGFGFAVVAGPVVQLFLGEKWSATTPIIQILSATFALQSLSTSLQPLAMSKAATKVLFARDVRTFLIRIPFTIAGYLWDGLFGVVVARAISSLIGTVWNMGLVAELSNISITRQFRNCSRSLFATASMVIATLIAQIVMGRVDQPISSISTLALSIGVGIVSYIGTSASLWMLTGRLQGPETEVGTIVSSLLARPVNFLRVLRYGRPQRIVSQAELITRPQTNWLPAIPADNRRRRAPRRFGPSDIDFSRMVGPLPELGVLVLPNGRALGKQGWACTAKGEIVRETTWFGNDLNDGMLRQSFGVARRLSGTCLCLISEFGAANYGHYLLDCLSRVGIVTKAGYDLSMVNHFYLYEPPSESARYLLGELGIDDARCIWADRVTDVIADILLVTTFPGTKRNYAAVVPETLARPFVTPASGHRRIYVPRQGVRKVSNSGEVEAISRELGLEIYDFRRVTNEFEYFRSAELVVGAHGAGLTNIAVCLPGTKILELVPSDHVYSYYYTLAEAAQLDYSYLVGDSNVNRPPGSFGPSMSDFQVNVGDYRQALTTLIGGQ